MTDFNALLRLLVENKVEFIIVGGAAATAHGSARLTLDLDLIIRSDGKQQQFYFFKDIANRGSRAYEILQVHKMER